MLVSHKYDNDKNMSHENLKTVALFISSEPHDEENDATKQALLRECAIKLSLTIVSFVALPKTSLFELLSQALSICKSNDAALLIDEQRTFFLSHRELENFLKVLDEYKISIIAARSGLILKPEYIALFINFLQLSAQAEHAQHSKSIKRSLKLKKRQGVKLGGKKFAEDEIIKQIVELYKLGTSLQEICNILCANDVKSAYNKKWYPTTIKRIIIRETKKSKNIS